jgi:MFS family permease
MAAIAGETTPSTMESNTQEKSIRTNEVEAPPSPNPPQLRPTGWRLVLLLGSLYTGLFLSFLDTTIVAVALPTIAFEFNDFSRATWTLTSYLLTYMAFAIIISRFSDFFGKKAVEAASFVIFIAFSLGCGLSNNMTELIVFRALQGIGGSGLFSMTMIIGFSIVQPKQIPMVGAGVGVVMVISGVLGPILSGAITHSRTSNTWRWIFYLNIPIGGLALAALLLAWPREEKAKLFTRNAFKSIDFLGCLLLLAASVLLIFALEEAGAYVYAWSSPTIIACLVISGVAAIAFIAWQECIAVHPDWTVQLVFPISVARSRILGSAIL